MHVFCYLKPFMFYVKSCDLKGCIEILNDTYHAMATFEVSSKTYTVYGVMGRSPSHQGGGGGADEWFPR